MEGRAGSCRLLAPVVMVVHVYVGGCICIIYAYVVVVGSMHRTKNQWNMIALNNKKKLSQFTVLSLTSAAYEDKASSFFTIYYLVSRVSQVHGVKRGTRRNTARF